MTILNDLKQFTYVMCYDCSSSHIMTYYDNEYECEECYRKIKFDAITFEDPTVFVIDFIPIKLNWSTAPVLVLIE